MQYTAQDPSFLWDDGCGRDGWKGAGFCVSFRLSAKLNRRNPLNIKLCTSFY